MLRLWMTRGKSVGGRRENSAQVSNLFTARRMAVLAWVQKPSFYSLKMPAFSTICPRPVWAFSPLLCGRFYPLSTAPITITKFLGKNF